MGDKTIPDSAESRLESFYPPFVAGIDLPHQGVVDSYNLSIPKLQRLHSWSLRMVKQFHPTLYNGCNYLSMLALELIQVSKRGH